MLYLLLGKSDHRKDYVLQLVKQYTATPQHVYDNDIADRELTDIVQTQTGLFGDKELYVIHDLARNLDLKSFLAEFAESDNVFVFSEESITKPILKAFEKVNAIIEDFGKEEKTKTESFNMFSLTDALGARDKKKLWLLFQEALKNGSPEEIHGILFWQLKNLALVHGLNTNPGMNPFVYKKTLGFAKNFSSEEIRGLSRSLTHTFHNRDTYSTLDIDIEKFILSL